LADKLNRLAEREHKTVDEVLERLLEGETTPINLPDKPRPGSGAALLKSALEADIHAGSDNLAENSRELLSAELPKHLLSRMDTPQNDPKKSCDG
jgi:hypothetical protein